MKSEFFAGNRLRLLSSLPDRALLLLFSGSAGGPSITVEEAKAKSGIGNVAISDKFQGVFHKHLREEKDIALFLNLDRFSPDQQLDEAHRFASYVRELYPQLEIKNVCHDMHALRVIKAPEEIENMKIAMEYTRLSSTAVIIWALMCMMWAVTGNR